MLFIKRLFARSNNPDSYAYKLEMAKKMHGQVVKYVTENRDGNDDVIGRGGAMALHDGKLIVDSSGDRIFMCNVEELDASYLMSGDGVIIKGPDLLNENKIRRITVHFVYYRK